MHFIDYVCRDTFSRCVSGNVKSRDCHIDSLNVIFPRFPNCFLPILLVFPHVSSRCFFGFVWCFPCFLSVFLLCLIDFTIFIYIETLVNARKQARIFCKTFSIPSPFMLLLSFLLFNKVIFVPLSSFQKE